jgi:hypothetical protein
MSKLKILVNFDFLKWFYIWIEKKKVEMEGGELVDNREYRRKKNRKLVSFLHRSNKDGTLPANEELPILKQ